MRGASSDNTLQRYQDSDWRTGLQGQLTVNEKERLALETDFARKCDTYFEANYGTATVQNALRRERRDQIVQWVEALDLRRVLDVGCGPALLYEDAYTRSETYYAMDLVESNLQKVQTCGNVEVIHADLDTLEWQHESPTLIICSGCLEYTGDGMKNLSKMCRLLDAGGVLVVSFPNAASPYRIWFEYGYRRLLRSLDRSKRRIAYSRTLFRLGTVVDCLEAEGMKVVAKRDLGFCFIPPPFDSWMPMLEFRLRRALEKRAPFLGRLSSEFLVLARNGR